MKSEKEIIKEHKAIRGFNDFDIYEEGYLDALRWVLNMRPLKYLRKRSGTSKARLWKEKDGA